MSCCAFNAPAVGLTAPDPCKRVNYTLGMLLGVDDFVQESAYHSERRRELARELLGYGTVHGLQLLIEDDGDRGPRVQVSPGMAWLPSGKAVCVDSPRCANLNEWLSAHASDVASKVVTDSDGSSRLTLYVLLAHAECLTDNVPIPGEPCRDQSELMQPSRVADSFCLSLSSSPPRQVEEDALRDFVAWLLQLPLALSSPPLSEEAFVEEIRAAARDWLPGSTVSSPPDFMLGSAPEGTNEGLFRAALRLWTTELRPRWMARAGCGCNAPMIAAADDALLLAELRVPLLALGDGSYAVDDGPAAIERDESRRPVLLSLRMLQELISQRPSPDPSDEVSDETEFGLAPAVGVSNAYARADHTHGSPALPDLAGDLSGALGDARVEGLQGVPLLTGSPLVDGHVLTYEDGAWVAREPASAEPPDPPEPLPDLAGDLSGALTAARIERLQTVPLVYDVPLLSGLVLTLEDERWVPREPSFDPTLSGDVVGSLGDNEISRLQGVGLAASEPSEGDVLRVRNGRWQPSQTFVERGMGQYEIIAAGEVNFSIPSGSPPTPFADTFNPYGGLVASFRDLRQGAMPLALLELKASPHDFDYRAGTDAYVVKLTPVLNDNFLGFQPYLFGSVKRSQDTIVFSVAVMAQDLKALMGCRFLVEVSRYETRGGT